MISTLPPELAVMLKDRLPEPITVGHSAAGVYRCTGKTDNWYLKVQPAGTGLRREYEVLGWLKEKLPVPAVIYFTAADKWEYLLTAEVPGAMLCSGDALADPAATIALLATGMRQLWSLDISDCPFDNSLDIVWKEVSENVMQQKISMQDWGQEHEFDSPEQLLQYLLANPPSPVTPVFTHGDYCLPNIFSRNGRITGFIDLGRAGMADPYQDIALCARSLQFNFKTDALLPRLFDALQMTPDMERIRYYQLLEDLY